MYEQYDEYAKMFENFNYIQKMPFVQETMQENLKLKKKNEELTQENLKLKKKKKELKKLLNLIVRNLNILEKPKKHKLRKNDDNEIEFIKIKEEKTENCLFYEVNDEPANVNIIINDNIQNETEETEEVVEETEEAVEETEETEVVVEETEEAVEETEETEEVVEETEETEEEVEETDESEKKDPDDSEEVYEVRIEGKTCYTTNSKSGIIYEAHENGDVGDEIGYYKNGNHHFLKK